MCITPSREMYHSTCIIRHGIVALLGTDIIIRIHVLGT